jgi:hypothetical protein
MSTLIATRNFRRRSDPSTGIDSAGFGATFGAAAILAMKVSMLWVALQAV